MESYQKALLIIDMQKGSFTSETPRYDTSNIISRINKLTASFRASENPVIWIPHNGARQNEFLPNTWEWELLDTLIAKSQDSYIEKYANDVFYRSRLHTYLTSKNIQELYVTGCATDFCVEATVQSALAKDYNITVVKNAHTTADRPHLTADKIIEHYNWVWQHMTPTLGTIQVMKDSDIISYIQPLNN